MNKKDSKKKCTKIRVTLPYVRGVSEAPSQVFCHEWSGDIDKTAPDTQKDAGAPKDKRTSQENSGVVYQVPCKDCECIYTGEM